VRKDNGANRAQAGKVHLRLRCVNKKKLVDASTGAELESSQEKGKTQTIEKKAVRNPIECKDSAAEQPRRKKKKKVCKVRTPSKY